MKTLILIYIAFCLAGCASMGRLTTDLTEIHKTGEAQESINASKAIVYNFMDEPYSSLIAIAAGYGMALLRRRYKQMAGSKG